jgi:DNA-binding FadR family transcriptional regulator
LTVTASQFAPDARAILTPKTGELIASQIRRQIVSGKLLEGDSLPGEVELMGVYRVSRPTLREAFRILEAEQLITIKRGSRGARVLAPSVAIAAKHFGALLQVTGTTVGDVYEARSLIEPAAVGLLASRRTREDLIELEERVDRVAEMAGSGVSSEEWAHAAQSIHEVIVRRAGNNTLTLQTQVLDEIVLHHVSAAVQASFLVKHADAARRYRLRSVRSYRRLVELITARASAEAVHHWQTHMEVAGKILLGSGLNETPVVDLFE